MQNNKRFDLSDYLIHFFRDVDLESDSYIHFPEHSGFFNICEDLKCSALFLMRCALRNNKLVASWSYRNGKRSIYGYDPAICFTDMPLAAFLQTSKERKARGEKIGEYALMLPKNDMFVAGARPVIYALDQNNDFKYLKSSKHDEKIIDPNVLPLLEQYRYVTYDPTRPTPIDWTHEREWRWACRDDISLYTQEIMENGLVSDYDTLPGLNFSMYPINGAGIVVAKNYDIEKVLYDVLTLIDSRKIDINTFKFIVSIENVEAYNILDPNNLQSFIEDNILDLKQFFEIDPNKEVVILKDIDHVINHITSNFIHDNEKYPEEIGKSWIWIVDNFSDVTRVLLKNHRIYVNNEGKYLLEIPNIEHYPLRKQEKICKEIALELSKKYSIHANYFSIRGHNNPDCLPYYTDFHDNNHPYYNYSKIV